MKQTLLQLGLLVLMIFTYSGATAQDDAPVAQRQLGWTLRFDGGFGNLLHPKAMKNNFYSVGDASAGAFIGIAKGLSLGITGRYTGFQVSRNASNKNDAIQQGPGITIYKPIRTTHNMFTPGISLGYERWITDYSAFSFNLNVGYSYVRYSKIPLATPDSIDRKGGNYKALLMEPAIYFMYFFEEHSAFYMKVSYSQSFAWFHPELVGLSTGEISYQSSELKGQINFMSFGIGFTYSFKRVE
jgi:hypothetical protein